MKATVTGKYSDHLPAWECACRCGCGQGVMRYEVVDLFEKGRKVVSHYMGKDTKHSITSGLRCEKHNAREGGSPNSKHMAGFALDIIRPDGIDLLTWALLWDSVVNGGGFGVYPSWTKNGKVVGGIHIDAWMDPFRRRWYEPAPNVKVVWGQYPPLSDMIAKGVGLV